MKHFYIAGPYRGPTPWDVEGNVREAEVLGLLVARASGLPIIPHSMYRFFDRSLPDEFWLEASADLLLRSDALVLHPSWQRSAGAKAEREVAMQHRMPILDLVQFVPALARVEASFTAVLAPFVRAVGEGYGPESEGETWRP